MLSSVTGQSPAQFLFCNCRLSRLHVSRSGNAFQSHWMNDTHEGMYDDHSDCCWWLTSHTLALVITGYYWIDLICLRLYKNSGLTKTAKKGHIILLHQMCTGPSSPSPDPSATAWFTRLETNPQSEPQHPSLVHLFALYFTYFTLAVSKLKKKVYSLKRTKFEADMGSFLHSPPCRTLLFHKPSSHCMPQLKNHSSWRHWNIKPLVWFHPPKKARRFQFK